MELIKLAEVMRMHEPNSTVHVRVKRGFWSEYMVENVIWHAIMIK